MGQMLLLSANPKRRRKSGKRRSAAQKAATRKMLAANRARSNPGSGKRRRRSAAPAVSRRASRRSARRSGAVIGGSIFNQAKGLAINGALGGAGALGVDVVMGTAANVLPASVTSRINSDGSTNYLYYGTKAAIALGVGIFGRKLVPANVAAKLAEGSLTVSSYELLRGMMPAGVPLGYSSPARPLNKIVRPGNLRLIRNMNSGGAGARPGMSRVAAQRGSFF